MVCTTTSTSRPRAAFTLVEILLVTALGSLVLVGVALLVFFSARSFAALTNYVDLDNYSRSALDAMTREIRQADKLVSATDHELVFQHSNPTNSTTYQVRYVYSPEAKNLTRIQGTSRTEVLKECFFLRFSIFQRNPIPGTYDQHATASPETCKLVQLSWVCSRDILGKPFNTESVQSAKVVIRKQ